MFLNFLILNHFFDSVNLSSFFLIDSVNFNNCYFNKGRNQFYTWWPEAVGFAKEGQVTFQTPGSNTMNFIIDLHSYIMFFLVFILFFVFIMLYFTVKTFHISNKSNSTLQKIERIKKLYNVDFTHNSTIEIIWLVIPSLILLCIAIPSFSLLYSMDSIQGDCDITIKITGHQWYWTYDYLVHTKAFTKKMNTMFSDSYFQNKILSFGYDSNLLPASDLTSKQPLRLLEVDYPLVLPIFTPIKLDIVSDDVLHAWVVPALGIKVDALPGRLTRTFLEINTEGRYYGQCSELCGVNHGFMPIAVHGVSTLDFSMFTFMNSWAAKDWALLLQTREYFLDSKWGTRHLFNTFEDSKAILIFRAAIIEWMNTGFATVARSY